MHCPILEKWLYVGQIPNHLKDGHYQGAKDQADLLLHIDTNMLMANVSQQDLPDKLKINFII